MAKFTGDIAEAVALGFAILHHGNIDCIWNQGEIDDIRYAEGVDEMDEESAEYLKTIQTFYAFITENIGPREKNGHPFFYSTLSRSGHETAP